MDIAKQIEKVIIDSLKDTVPATLKKEKKLSSFIDSSTKPIGFSKILKNGYTP